MLSGPVFVDGVQPAIVAEELAIAAWEAIARRRTREPSRRLLLPLEQDPYLLRHVLGLENAIAENPELLKPLSDEALRKLQRTKGARRRGATRE